MRLLTFAEGLVGTPAVNGRNRLSHIRPTMAGFVHQLATAVHGDQSGPNAEAATAVLISFALHKMRPENRAYIVRVGLRSISAARRGNESKSVRLGGAMSRDRHTSEIGEGRLQRLALFLRDIVEPFSLARELRLAPAGSVGLVAIRDPLPDELDLLVRETKILAVDCTILFEAAEVRAPAMAGTLRKSLGAEVAIKRVDGVPGRAWVIYDG